MQLRHHGHLRLLPATALQAHRAPLVRRPVPLLRPPRPDLDDVCVRQHPHAARESAGHGLLRGAERVRVLRGRAGDFAVGGSVGLFYVYVSYSITNNRFLFTRMMCSCLCLLRRLLLFLLFFPRASPMEPSSTNSSAQPSYKTAILVTTACGINALLTLVVSFLVIHLAPASLQGYASALGVAGTLLAGAQYFPQIFTTWRLQSVGSLSIPMMCIQTPGSFVFAGNLAARLGWAGWSTWGLFIFTGILQGTVLAMGISFAIRDRRKRREMEEGNVGNGHAVAAEGEEEEEENEETPLLGDR